MPTPFMELRAITKRYPGVVANDAIDMTLNTGEVHVLLGENGAGKSTLVAMLAGMQKPDAGEIRIDGRATDLSTPQRALHAGISTVFQHSMLVPSLTLAENVALGGRWWQNPNRRATAARMRTTGESIGVTLRPDALTETLSLGERQQGEIVRALMRGARMLILDEATALLTPADAARLGDLMRRLAANGTAVVFITHKLNEAIAFGDRISVLRAGRNIGTIDIHTTDPHTITDQIVGMMFGTHRSHETRPPPRAGSETVLECAHLHAASNAIPLHDITISVASGEILGIAGIDGNGQKELAEVIAGQRPVTGGHIALDNRPITNLSIGERRRAGLRYVTDDRLGEGTVADMAVSLNLLLKQIGRKPFWKNGIIRPTPINDHARRMVDDFDIRTPSIDTPVGKLSGGNIQKVLLARELTDTARAVIFAKPTYGLDLHNITATRRRIRQIAERGYAVILFSTELDELLQLSTRIAVMSNGRIIDTIPNDAHAHTRIGALISRAHQ